MPEISQNSYNELQLGRNKDAHTYEDLSARSSKWCDEPVSRKQFCGSLLSALFVTLVLFGVAFYFLIGTTKSVSKDKETTKPEGKSQNMFFSGNITTWPKAQTYCQSKGANLAAIETEEEWLEIYGILFKSVIPVFGSGELMLPQQTENTDGFLTKYRSPSQTGILVIPGTAVVKQDVFLPISILVIAGQLIIAFILPGKHCVNGNSEMTQTYQYAL